MLIYMKNQNPKIRICVYSQMQIDYAHIHVTSYMLITEGITVCNVLFHRKANASIPLQRCSSNYVSGVVSSPPITDNHDSIPGYTFSIAHGHWWCGLPQELLFWEVKKVLEDSFSSAFFGFFLFCFWFLRSSPLPMDQESPIWVNDSQQQQSVANFLSLRPIVCLFVLVEGI